MTRAELQALQPGDVVEFRDFAMGGKETYKTATVVKVFQTHARLLLPNRAEIKRTYFQMRKEGVKT